MHSGGVDVPIKFSEAVSDFVQADLTLTENTAGATITAWTASTDGTTYTATITPQNSGVVTLSVAADVATDDAGNSNTAATSWTVEFDLDPPTAAITGPTSSITTESTEVTIVFSEAVSDFVQADLTLTGNTATITEWTANDDNVTYTATITPSQPVGTVNAIYSCECSYGPRR